MRYQSYTNSDQREINGKHEIPYTMILFQPKIYRLNAKFTRKKNVVTRKNKNIERKTISNVTQMCANTNRNYTLEYLDRLGIALKPSNASNTFNQKVNFLGRYSESGFVTKKNLRKFVSSYLFWLHGYKFLPVKLFY